MQDPKSSALDSQLTAKTLPKVGLPTVFQLGLFNLGLGLMSVLTLAVLNRVMIDELKIPAAVTAGVLAMAQIVAPARVWFGQLSDTKPLFGLHRTGYVRLGTLLFGLAVMLAVQVVWPLGHWVQRHEGVWQWNSTTLGWTLLLGLIFAGYGLALSASSTPFTALLVDISEEKDRSRIVAIVWSLLMVGIIIGGISGSIVLKIEPSATQGFLEVLQTRINKVFGIVPLIVLGLAILATWRVERRFSRFASRSSFCDREENITLGRAWKILRASRQTGIFFSFLVLLTLGLFMQEAVLEPYGGEVFNMSVAETTQLNAFWGVGILVGYSLTGFVVIPRLGKQLTTKIGCFLVACSFSTIILAGFTQMPSILQAALILFGVATGFATVGALSLMLDLTAAETAGTFIGAWGLAQALSRAIAIFLGGVILDGGRTILREPLLAYGSVFALQAVLMIGAIYLLDRVNIQEFRENTQGAIMAMEDNLDG